MQLPEYLSTMFPGLQLTPPLFYSWPVGLRFELGTKQQGMSYDEVVLHRANTLYEAAFSSHDLCWIVSGTTQCVSTQRGAIKSTGGKFHTYCPTVFKFKKPLPFGLSGAAGRYRFVSHEDEDTREITTLRWASIQPRRIEYKRIFHAKANNDYHLRQPRTSDRVYFVNRTRNLILLMYDDRGLDLVAVTKGDIQAIYQAYKSLIDGLNIVSWVLDYDRARIENVFGP